MKILKTGLFLVLSILSFQSTYAQQATPEFKREFLENINHTRQKGCNCGGTYMPPAPALVWNDDLAVAALKHAGDMSKKNYFSHTSLDGRTSDQRMMNA